MRKGVYIVPTSTWYIERTVWLLAGCVLLGATALALFVDRRFILLVVATGLSSMAVGVSGYCLLSTALKRLGFRGRLESPGPSPFGLYRMQTDSWYLERRIYLVVGFNMTVASVLALVHSPWWLAFTGFVGTASLWFAATGFCIMANGFYWMGAEPRLAPLGHAPALDEPARAAA